MTAARKTTRAPRQTKTPRQRAEERLGVLERQYTRLSAKKQDADDESESLAVVMRDLEKRLAHARQDPDLQDGDDS